MRNFMMPAVMPSDNDNYNKLDIGAEEKVFEFIDEEEMKAAQLACCGRVCNRCETPAAYAWRKREVDLAILLILYIYNYWELSVFCRKFLCLVFRRIDGNI